MNLPIAGIGMIIVGLLGAGTWTAGDNVPATFVENQGANNSGSDAGEFRANIVGSDSVDCACDAQYDVGDRVVSTVDNPDSNPDIIIGSKGTVVCGGNNPFDLPILVKWDDIASGWDGGGYCECGNTDPPPSSSRWWVLCEWIEHDTPVWTVDDDAGADFYYIQDAIDAASDGDEILVYPGTYTDTGDNVVDMMGKALWLHSSDGPETTIIDGEDVRRGIACVTAETSETVIEGFTITRGSTVNLLKGAYNNGAGMICENSSPTLTNCVFTNNTTSIYSQNGGGLANHSSSPTLTNCVFDGNTSATAGGGMYNATNSSPTLTNCTFRNNACLDGTGGGGMKNGSGSNPTLTNCIIENNTSATNGGGMYNSGSPTLTNCIIENNSATNGGGMYNLGSPTLTDTTVCGNTPDQINGAWNDGGGNFVADTCSGDPTGACCVGTSCSIETYPYCSAAGGTYLGDGSSCSGDPCSAGSNVWTVDDSGGADFYDIQSAVDAASDGDEILVYPGTYTSTGDNVVDMMGKSVWLHSSDGPETTIIDGEDVRRGILYVNAMSASLDGFTIQNCYAPLIDFGGTFLRLGGGLYIEDSSLVMTNCTIDSNDASGSVGWGGGVFSLNAINLVFTDCTFSNNFGDRDGGGVFHYFSIFELENCTFESNNAFEGGGGLYVQGGSGTIVGCIISNNSALTGIVGSSGGGIYNLETAGGVITLTNTTVCDNTPDQIVGNWIDGGGNTVADTCSGDPTGACCVDTSCSTGTAADCSAAGGTYLGDGTTCSGDPCGGDPTGACCVGTSCSIETYPYCSAAGGTYLGDGSSCSGDPCSAGSNVWTVDDSGGADFYNIQDAIDVASDGDEILVYPGTYTDTLDNVVDMMGKSIWLHSSDGPETTIIDGEGVRRGILCNSGETSKTIFEGFTITGGYELYGAGILCYNYSNPTLTDCTFTGNNAVEDGGGMFNDGSNPTLTNCTFEANACNLGLGGGMYNSLSSPSLTNCTFIGNTSWDGGGMCNEYSSPTLTSCTFEGNISDFGGGMENHYDSSPTMTDCTFTGNYAFVAGGGIGSYSSNPTLIDTTVCGNSPDQIYGDWTDNGGNYVADTCDTFTDCNGNGIPDDEDIANGTSEDCNLNVIPDECDIADGTSYDDNLNGIPDECEDCNDNKYPDFIDIASGISQDCNDNGIPDECDIDDGTSEDCNGNGIPDECEPLNDCNDNGISDICELEDNDCNGNSIPDDCELEDNDCNSNNIPDDCETDCNGNGVPDDCDIDDGSSNDVNSNGIPDECEDCNGNGLLDEWDIKSGISEDCNANGIPDECDIEDGTSEDVCGDGIPDECQCLADLNGDGLVDVQDVLMIIGVWGDSDVPEDVNCDGIVETADLLSVIAALGNCP